MKARIYIRVSTEEQAKEGFSLAAQEEKCRQYIKFQGWEYDGIYKDDGFSGKDLKRPAIQQLLRDVKQREFDALVVYRLDRLTRSVVDLHYLLDLFDKHKVVFKSATEPYETTSAIGRLFVSIVGSLAQWERENMIERIKMAMEKRALEGKRNGATPPYGYKLVDGQLIPHPEEAKVVRRIFELYRHHGLLSIVKQLNDEGLRTRSGSLWSIYVVAYMLKNPVYIGKLRYRYRYASGKKQNPDEVMVYNGDHEPIIPLDLWNEVQKKNAERQRKAKAMTSEYPFSGILFCGRCGKPMHGFRYPSRKRDRYYYYYRCIKHAQYKECMMPQVSEMALEKALFSQLRYIAENIQADPEQIEEPEPERTREDIQKELQTIRRRKKKWQLAYAEDVITLEELRERTAEDTQREKELLKELETLEESPSTPELDKEELIERLKQLEYIWANATRRERKEILHSFFSRLVIDADMSIKRTGSRHRPVKIIEYELAYQ
ncbi:MAG: recombinase family protein [Clostridia bacterium]